MNASHLLWIKAGDRVRLKADHSATGLVDEVFEGIASVVWDISGCVGDEPVGDIEKYLAPEGYAGDKFMLCDELEVTPLIRDGETIEKLEPFVGDFEQHEQRRRRVAYIPHRPFSGHLMASMLGAMMVSGLGAANIFREEPIRNTTDDPARALARAERHERELAAHNRKIDEAEAKRQRKAEKRRLAGRL